MNNEIYNRLIMLWLIYMNDIVFASIDENIFELGKCLVLVFTVLTYRAIIWKQNRHNDGNQFYLKSKG